MKLFATFAVALLAAVGLAGWGAYSYRVETRPVLPAEIEQPERDLGETPVGTSVVTFRITNPTDHAVEVVGAPEGCGKVCCLCARVTDRQTIPPGGTLDLVCDLKVMGAEPFEFTSKIYLSDNGLRPIKIVVRGVGVAPGNANAPKL